MFWNNMQLWQKMLLVLAGGIAATFVFGFGKLLQQRMRLRKHTKMQAEQKARLEQIRNSRPVIQLDKDEVPFGIRAIEAGIEVEGVVISRPGTPFSLPQRSAAGSTATLVGSDGQPNKAGSSNGSRTSLGHSPTIPRPVFAPAPSAPSQPAVLRKAPPRVYQPSPYINMPPQAYDSSGRSSMSSLNSNGSPVGSRNGSGDFTPSTPDSFQSSTDFHAEPLFIRGGMSGDLPKPGSGFIDATFIQPPNQSLAKVEGRYEFQGQWSLSAPDLPTMTNTESGSSSSSNSSSASSSPPDILSPFLQPVFEGEPSRSADNLAVPSFDFEFPFRNRPKHIRASTNPLDYRGDAAHSSLSMLDLHRRSHAAEVGQLQSRKRLNQQSINGSHATSSSVTSVTYTEIEQNLLQDGRPSVGRPISTSTDGTGDERLTESQQWVIEALEGTGITQPTKIAQISFEPEVPAYMTRDPPGAVEEAVIKRLSVTLSNDPKIVQQIVNPKPERRRLQKRKSQGANVVRPSLDIAV